MASKPEFGLVVEYVTDVERAKRFYVDVLGLQVVDEQPGFVQFPSFGIGSRDLRLGDGAPEVYWFVADAEAAYAELSPRAEVSLPLRQMPFGKVFAVKDPAGRSRYMLELPSSASAS